MLFIFQQLLLKKAPLRRVIGGLKRRFGNYVPVIDNGSSPLTICSGENIVSTKTTQEQ